MKSLILPPLDNLYALVIRARNALYERGTFITTKLERPVISVGNITTGGTGKTPLVEWIARTVAGEGKKVCILSRGYGRNDPKRQVLVSDGETVFSSPAEAGDEPYLLARNLRGIAAVISDANRVAAAQGAIKHLRTDCFLLDDGFQHRRLARDLDIVTIDATNPFGGRRMLPTGRLREPLESLKRADCIVLTRCDQVDDLQPIKSDLQRFSGDRPVFQSTMNTVSVVPLNPNSEAPTTQIPFVTFCGIGNPQAFFKHLERTGYRSVLQKSFGDHHVYTQNDIDRLQTAANEAGAEHLLTTAKDAVKLRDLRFDIPCYSVEIEMKIENEQELRRLIQSSMSDNL
jgi:tetraacyldisaccharide 4'-kinase